MSHQVIKVSANQLKKMENYYQKNKLSRQVPHSTFGAKIDGCTITAYKSGKVLFQGKNAAAEASKWTDETIVKPKKVDSHSYEPPNNIQDLAVIGSDEVGTGDYFGPMTVAAAFVSPENYDQLKSWGVKDSKNLSDEKMRYLAKEIVKIIPYSLLVLKNEKYNGLQAQGYTQTKMKAMLHQQALHKTTGKIDNKYLDGYLVDQFTPPAQYFNMLSGQKNVIKNDIYFATKGESVHMSVACASIIARASFLKEMDRLSEIAGTELPKGAGPGVDEAAAKLIQSRGWEILDQIAKKHFGNTEKAQKLLR